MSKLASGQLEKARLQLVLGHRRPNNLVLHLAVFEKQEKRNGANTILDRELASIIDIDFTHLGLALHLFGELVDDRADHFAGTTPSGPEVHQNGDIGFDDFGLEIAIGQLDCHGATVKARVRNVKSRPEKILSGS